LSLEAGYGHGFLEVPEHGGEEGRVDADHPDHFGEQHQAGQEDAPAYEYLQNAVILIGHIQLAEFRIGLQPTHRNLPGDEQLAMSYEL
jgi:hypothetical protein